MTTASSISTTFLERAQREAQRYGEDPWVFLRELVQNSRDAYARTIQFTTDVRDGWTCLHCQDDGSGMNLHELEHYLLRLYASSKEHDQQSVGFFGVGFWSVLLYQPSRIRVATRVGDTTHAFMIDVPLRRIEAVNPPPAMDPGTLITLARPSATDDDPQRFADIVRERLVHYVAPVRGAGGRPTPRLLFHGDVLNAPLPIPAHGGLHFERGRFDGVLGFGNNPQVSIYKQGILVRELSSLDEVIPSRETHVPASGWGLHPIIAINIDDLAVLMDRQSVSEDPILYDAVAFVEKRLLAFHREWVQRMFPMDWRNRLRLGLSKLARGRNHLRKGLLWLLTPLVAGLAMYWFLTTVRTPSEQDTSGLSVMNVQNPRLDHAHNNTNLDHANHQRLVWQFQSSTSTPQQLFRIATLARFDTMRGFIREKQVDMRAYPDDIEDTGNGEAVRLFLPGADDYFVLPTPPNQVVLPASVRFRERPVTGLRQNHHGDAIVRLQGNGVLAYRTVERRKPAPPPLMFPIPELAWPADYRRFLDSIRGLDADQALAAAARWLQQRYRYDTKPLRRLGGPKWLNRVLANDYGDCDILNGLLVLMMREVDHPAHLCVGLITENGEPQSNLHAWVRYYERGWRFFDITPHLATALADETQTARQLTQPSNQTVGANGGQPARLPPDVVAQLSAPPPNPTGPTLATQGAPPTSDGPSQLLAWGLGGLAALLIGTSMWLIIRQRRNPPTQLPLTEKPDYLRELFHHYLAQGNQQDPLQLAFRPVFPTLDGRYLSLTQLNRLAEQGHVYAAMPNQRLLDDIPPAMTVLDNGADVVVELQDFLPDIHWLFDWEEHERGATMPPIFQAIERTIRRWDPRFSLYLLLDANDILELVLPPTKHQASRHLIGLGPDHPLRRELPTGDRFDEFDTFNGVQTLLEQSTLYLPYKDAMLAQLATQITVTP